MELTRDLPIQPAAAGDADVGGITHDSRQVRRGDLFVALTGERFDGRSFAREALSRGAVAVLGAGPAPPGLEREWMRAERPRELLGPLAARLHGHPDRELVTVGVTGTNGKSTVVALTVAILEAAGRPTGSLGTLGYRFRDRLYAGPRTTPEASELFSTLRDMRDRGAEAVAMEVSSHALAQGRVEGAAFDVALFTNLTRDHFDFHPDFESYFRAKRSLFGRLKPDGRAVVNTDDPYGARLAEELPAVLAYGARGEVRVLDSELDADGIRARVATPRGEVEIASGLLGDFNMENLLAAVAVAEALELRPAAVAEGIAARGPLPGRMEPVRAGQPFPVLVDYAHTDAALEAALRSLRGFAGGRLIVVFGCGGDRDPGKRVLMGRVAGSLAERAIVTSDNPRSEDPLAILAAVETGLAQSGASDYAVVPDRRAAIRRAIAEAGEGWSVLIAGKGHEEVQVVGDRELPFSDRREALAALEERFG